MTKTFCDRCNREIEPWTLSVGYAPIVAYYGADGFPVGWDGPHRATVTVDIKGDLHPDCADKLRIDVIRRASHSLQEVMDAQFVMQP